MVDDGFGVSNEPSETNVSESLNNLDVSKYSKISSSVVSSVDDSNTSGIDVSNASSVTAAKALTVAVCLVVHDGKILLQKRKRGNYVGYWCLPGGKVDAGEHISSGAIREILEETGLTCNFESHLGVVSELLIEKFKFDDENNVDNKSRNLVNNFNLHLCKMQAPHSDFVANLDEGELKWFNYDESFGVNEVDNSGSNENEVDMIKDKIIPSDYLMFDKMFLKRGENSGSSYYNCVIEKIDDEHKIVKFE
jgi:8-oxo-dGTP pyrophosphatase MutT (NUDIX family)